MTRQPLFVTNTTSPASSTYKNPSTTSGTVSGGTTGVVTFYSDGDGKNAKAGGHTGGTDGAAETGTGTGTDADRKEVTVTSMLNSKTKDGYFDVEIAFDATELAGHDVVVFEKLYDGDELIASHEEIEDKGQTIHFPEIRTSLKDEETGEHVSFAKEDVTLVDTVTYKGLYAGKEYVLTGVLYDPETRNHILDDDGKKYFSAWSKVKAVKTK